MWKNFEIDIAPTNVVHLQCLQEITQRSLLFQPCALEQDIDKEAEILGSGQCYYDGSTTACKETLPSMEKKHKK